MSQSPRSELAGILFKEIEGYIPEIDLGISLLKDSAQDEETLKEVYRLFHNIKGAASQVPYTGLSQSAAICEAVVADLLESEQSSADLQCDFLTSINQKIGRFCLLPEKDQGAEDELFITTLTSFSSLMENLPTHKAIILPDYIEERLSGLIPDIVTSAPASSMNLQQVQEECIASLRSIIPLLQELTACSSSTDSSQVPESVLTSISKAIRTLAQCSRAAGLDSQNQLLSSFLQVLYQLQNHSEHTVENSSQLLQEFLSYVDLVFSMPAQQGEAVISKVQHHFDTLSALFPPRSSRIESNKSYIKQTTEINGPLEVAFDFQQEELVFSEDDIPDYDVFIESSSEDCEAIATASLSFNINSNSPAPEIITESDEHGGNEFELNINEEDLTDDVFSNEVFSFGTDTFVEKPCLTADAHPKNEELYTNNLSEDELELLAIFQAECDEHLQSINIELNALERTITAATPLSDFARETIGRMRRGVHTLKGAASMTGYFDLSTCTHSLEDLLDWIHDKSDNLVPSDVTIIAEAIDSIETLSQFPDKSVPELSKSVSDSIKAHLELRTFVSEDVSASLETTDATDIPTTFENGSSEILSEMFENDTNYLDEINSDDIYSAIDETVDSKDLEVTKSDTLPDEDQKELLEIFQAECEEHLLAINTDLNILVSKVNTPFPLSPEIREPLARMRRGIHTLKGAAAMTGFETISSCAHTTEDLLDWLHDTAPLIEPADVMVIGNAVDAIEALAESESQSNVENAILASEKVTSHLSQQIENSIAPLKENLEEIDVAELDAVQNSETTEQNEREQAAIIEMQRDVFLEQKPEDAPPQPIQSFQRVPDAHENTSNLPADTGNIRVKLNDLDELVNIEGELVVARGSIEKLLDKFSQSLSELNTIKDTLRRKSQELEVGFEAQSLYGFGSGPLTGMNASDSSESSLSDFDPIELDRYSQLNLIIRSLNEISIDVNAIHSEMTTLGTSIEGQVAKQQLSMGLMQEKLMRIRMTPLSSISRMLFRTVRQTSQKLGKTVQLTITGEDVFMDRFIWTKTIDPLMHILRNCVDHGIEDKQIRTDAGKETAGHINIKANQRGRFVILTISDDGQGVDIENLRHILIEDGSIPADAQLSDKELLPFLFRPSFSTKDDVSQVSGRGVGLDVVLRNIQELRGTVQIHNNPGKGITFELSIPITLSVNRAVIVGLSSKQFAVPIQDVTEVRKFERNELTGENQSEVVWNDQTIPLLDLAPHLQVPINNKDSSPKDDMLTLIVDTGGSHVAMKIDRVEEQREIVIKDLGSHLRYVRGINGVTLTGEGDIIPILNLRELSTGNKPVVATTIAIAESISEQESLKVLVVDDSISVRFSVTRLVEGQSWQAFQAVDGIDALEKLETVTPDVIILDIEMPRMNGYEFMGMIRNNEKYCDIPVIMLTSRASEKHRKKAEELGANHYMTKPFQEDSFIELLSTIK